MERAGPGPDPRIGLCAACDRARTVVSARGSVFWLCTLSARDGPFPKYPALPVLRCPGFEGRQRSS